MKRNFKAVRWRLWWDGFPIKTRYVRDGLKKVSAFFSDFKTVYVDPETGDLKLEIPGLYWAPTELGTKAREIILRAVVTELTRSDSIGSRR